MFKKSGILTFYCETPLHMGAGTSVSYVDLPIQRERHTDFPIMQATGIKGVLREAFERQTDDKILTELIFGPEEGDSFASCISITDAKILLFPVRSASGIFAWITCPFVLERFKKDIESTEMKLDNFNIPEISNQDEIILSKDSILKVMEEYVFLEEYVFNINKEKTSDEIVEKIKKYLPSNNLINTLSQRFGIVHNDVFTDFVKMAVEIRTRIKIDQTTGTVGEGPFVEEFVPSESIFYSLIFFESPHLPKEKTAYIEVAKKENLSTEEDVFKKIDDKISNNPIFQFGGDETVGSGIVRVKLSNCESESKNESNKEKPKS